MTCSRCGLCCTSTRGERLVVCEYLEHTVLGEPNGTQCRVYADRYHLMPIRMLDDTGEFVRQTRCVMGMDAVTAVIAKKGLGSRCSLTDTPRT